MASSCSQLAALMSKPAAARSSLATSRMVPRSAGALSRPAQGVGRRLVSALN
jgi:hypothetical protein